MKYHIFGFSGPAGRYVSVGKIPESTFQEIFRKSRTWYKEQSETVWGCPQTPSSVRNSLCILERLDFPAPQPRLGRGQRRLSHSLWVWLEEYLIDLGHSAREHKYQRNRAAIPQHPYERCDPQPWPQQHQACENHYLLDYSLHELSTGGLFN